MNSHLKISFALYALNAVFMMLAGLIYAFSNEFMPYHADVIQTKWEDVGELAKILYIGMMRTEAAGFLASGVAISILLFIPFRKHEKWSFGAITIIGTVEYLPTFLATYHVSTVTNASPPWLLMLIMMISLVLALGFAVFGSKTEPL